MGWRTFVKNIRDAGKGLLGKGRSKSLTKKARARLDNRNAAKTRVRLAAWRYRAKKAR